jgi:hypothetical protein
VEKNLRDTGGEIFPAFSETPQKIPPYARAQKTQPAWRALIFPPIHSAHHNNKLYRFLSLKKSLLLL